MQKKIDTADLTKMAMCVALMCVTAFLAFPLPFTPGMVTALTIAMSLTAYILPPKQTFTVILIYLLLGGIGVPVFAGGAGLGINRLSRIKRVQRRRNKFQALCICKRRGDNADNLRRRCNLNDVGNANNVDSSADNGGIAVHFGRRLESGGGGIHRSKIKFKIEKQGAALMDTKNLTVAEIAERIINGERLKNSDDVNILLDAELDEVQRGAGSIQKKFCGNHIDLCTIINGKSGRCGE